MSEDLARLLARTSARGILAYDQGGEMLGVHGEMDEDVSELMAVVLSHLNEIGASIGIGEPHRFVIEAGEKNSFTEERPDGSFITLHSDPRTPIDAIKAALEGKESPREQRISGATPGVARGTVRRPTGERKPVERQRQITSQVLQERDTKETDISGGLDESLTSESITRVGPDRSGASKK